MENGKETATTTSFGGNVWGSRYPNKTSAYSCSNWDYMLRQLLCLDFAV